MKKVFFLLLVIGFGLAGCEKDDICDPATPTTPRLVIQFFDQNNVTLPRRVTNLKIIGDGVADDVGVPNEQGGQVWNDTIAYVPLRVNADATKFRFVLNADDNVAANDITDVLDFNYSRLDTYVSRACGFKTTFDLFGTSSDPFILNGIPNSTEGNWIDHIEVLQPNINDENETHIRIYF